MTITHNNIQVAQSIIARIGFMDMEEGGEPGARIPLWLAQEGIDYQGLMQAAAESADATVTEIRDLIEEGGSFGETGLREKVHEEFFLAFLVGVVCARREQERVAESQPST